LSSSSSSSSSPSSSSYAIIKIIEYQISLRCSNVSGGWESKSLLGGHGSVEGAGWRGKG
jgi:hypothetical protein